MKKNAGKIPPGYNPSESEPGIYRYWEENGYFAPGGEGEPYCIVIPPPNITGSLHMGHALNNSIQDCLVRWNRMRGMDVLWMPGVDHAGIAAQNVVDRWIASRGSSREVLGRERFIEKVWEWKRTYGDTIVRQLRLLGSSCDWSRLRFTMDDRYSRSVTEAFVRLYGEGLIYRGNRLINWCPDCRTAISDIEVEHEETEGSFYHIRYPGEDGEGIIIATTRPETMLGDVAVAVHPGDGRYGKYVGGRVRLPLKDSLIPVIADDRVDRDLGTGALKITPAHDAADFEIGETHGLPSVKVIGEDGRMTTEAGRYSGQDRFECRKNVLADLEAAGLLVKTEPYRHSVGRCYRCSSVIEPLVSLQWFVRMDVLAPPAAGAVEEGRVRFFPGRWKDVYLNWMAGIKDWCISRQIWWGHRLPVWHCVCGEISVARSEPAACAACGGSDLKRDEDVLDTWFSSALWPFAGTGWPEETGDLRRFYPTSALVTGHEIIYFWVARMIMMGIKFMGREPFGEVYIHGIIRDEKGRKMSKSLGNVVDPREAIEKCGTDALRLALLASVGGQDIRFGEEKLEGMRNFVNKAWNAGRFISMHLPAGADSLRDICRGDLTLDDEWILSEAQKLKSEISELLGEYEFSRACQLLYEFTWHKFCDWYLELVKPRLAREQEKRVVLGVLVRVWKDIVKLMHPFAPFVTESLWRLLPEKTRESESVMVSPWPAFEPEFYDEKAMRKAGKKFDLIHAGRKLRTEQGLGPAQKAEFIAVPADAEEKALLEDGLEGIKILLGASRLSIKAESSGEKSAAAVTASGTSLYIRLDEADRARNLEKLKKELGSLRAEMERRRAKLGNSGFLEKAPREVVLREKKRQEEAERKAGKILRHIGEMEEGGVEGS